MRSDSASVQSTDSRGKVVKNRFTFFAQIIVVYIIIITSLVQISLRSPDKELCQQFYWIHLTIARFEIHKTIFTR